MDQDLPVELVERIRRRGGAATIYDVAALAGVNPSTVSRALSKPGRVSEKTTGAVRAAAERLDFTMNPMARALPTGRSHTIGLIVADITNPMIFGIARGAERVASRSGFTLVFAESQESGQAEEKVLARLLPSVDGIILATPRLPDERIARVVERKPVVLINRRVEGVVSVVPDVAQGVEALVDHLVELGHDSLGYLAGPENSWMSARRWEALLDATERRQVGLVQIGSVSPNVEGGYEALRRVRASRATAIVAFNDLVAMGLMQAAGPSGIRVPGDISVAGFDDIFGSELVSPSLTTVRADLEHAGCLAVEHLIAALDSTSRTIDTRPLETLLVVRDSTGSPAAQG